MSTLALIVTLIRRAIIFDLHPNIALIPSVVEDCRNYQTARSSRFTYTIQWILGPSALFKFTMLSFRYRSPVGKVIRIKIPLKHGIHFASCTLIVTPFSNFGNCLAFFFNLFYFFRCESSSTFVVRANSMTFHDVVMMFQFLQLTFIIIYNNWRYLFITFATSAAPLTNEPKIPNRISKILSITRFAIDNI